LEERLAHTTTLNPIAVVLLGAFLLDLPAQARDVERSSSNFRVLAAWTEAQRSQIPETQIFDSSTLFLLWTPFEYLNESVLIQPQIGIFPYANPSENLFSVGTELVLSGQASVWEALSVQVGAGIQGWLFYDRKRSASAFVVQLGVNWDLNPTWYKVRSFVVQINPFFFLNEKPLVFPQAMQYRLGLEFEL
jgi:hypothetical protein